LLRIYREIQTHDYEEVFTGAIRIAVNLLHRGLDGLFHLWVDFGGCGVGLAVHPLVEAGALEAPAIAEFEGGDEAFGGVLVKGVRRNTEVVGGLADIHDLANFRDKKIGAEGGVAHDGYPRQDSGDGSPQAGDPVYNSVSAGISRYFGEFCRNPGCLPCSKHR